MFKLLTMLLTLLSSMSIWAANECLECHDDMLDKMFKHQAAVDDCSSCHHPDHDMRTGFPYRLYERPNQLCLKCHKIGTGGHGHPVLLPQDPLYPKKEFTCISCHNPHSAKMETLFRYDYSKTTPYQGQRCAVCHWHILFPGQPPAPPPWYQ